MLGKVQQAAGRHPAGPGAILGLEPRPGPWASNPDRGALRRRS